MVFDRFWAISWDFFKGFSGKRKCKGSNGILREFHGVLGGTSGILRTVEKY